MLPHLPFLVQGTEEVLGRSVIAFRSPNWDYIVPLSSDQYEELRANKVLRFGLLCLEHHNITPVQVQIERKEYA